MFCGLCHTDLFLAKESWGASLTLRPLVAGHEIIGRVLQRGARCRLFDLADLVGVGFISEACGVCGPCQSRYPAGCEGSGFISTFSAINIYRQDRCLGTGGFGRHVVIHEKYAIRIPAKLVDASLPLRCSLLCGGLVVWASLKAAAAKFGVRWPTETETPAEEPCLPRGRRLCVGVVGLGTVGHLAAQMVCASGLRLLCVSANPRKEVAIRRLCPGSDFVLMNDSAAVAKFAGKVDILIDCCVGLKKFEALLSLLSCGGTMIALAIPPETHVYGLDTQLLARRQVTLTGAFMGSLQDAEDLLEWVANRATQVKSRATVVPISRINDATQHMNKNEVFDGEHFAVVFDLKSSTARR
eukprot:Gregarina_sp_Pseudo_9__838@NODE_1536_length_1512_cov_15_238968_g1423_i0_p1_GENE_NODE_1536_length_1512_cov_15_238968_g1423_i0NODE_1536_length_1512_cov_15_238968_g1423_i0_p1_ORF_typecomplete_len355_score113_63ADH_N/PF08240_12/1_3e13ADH_zinc_N/PF00107_26/1_2e11Glu_dehyd_C/PF16912_5/1_6e09ADH_zinc_N_2/PF13602_6/4_2e06AlaDh_PNT_C/PF01262_21/0_00162Hacid_dh_C/PF02826_19/0_0017AdoHcyase_NAD/PF00670_21/0_5AdoHcyase_NAD/PF00670_21/3_8e02_NODE_1536_length_1512_cov_15_238968_g1423_i01711235